MKIWLSIQLDKTAYENITVYKLLRTLTDISRSPKIPSKPLNPCERGSGFIDFGVILIRTTK